jgi:flagellar hook assembly protein FlgD
VDGDEDGAAACDAGAYEFDPDEAPSDTTPPVIADVNDSPDPFTPRGRSKKTTRISFTLSEQAIVTVTIENRAGTVVRTLLNSVVKAAGPVATRWNGKSTQRKFVKPGRYKYRISARDNAGNESSRAGVVTVKRP